MALNPLVAEVLNNGVLFKDEIPKFAPIGTYDPSKDKSGWVQLPYPAKQGEVAGIFSPLNPFNWGSKVPEIREQVQQGTYDPEEDVVSPTDQFLRGVSGRNRKLQEIMDQAGW